jgi:Protein of unknown function (DUF2380)
MASAVMLTMLLAGGGREGPVYAVAPTSLNNLSPEPDSRVDSAVIVRLTHAAQARLAECGFPVVRADSAAATANQGPGYLFEHSDLAAAWGAAHRADWVLVGRLNRIGTWEADWEVHVVSVSERRTVDTRSIELKGFDTDSGLTERLAVRGAAWIVDQVTQSVAHATPAAASNPRPCRA